MNGQYAPIFTPTTPTHMQSFVDTFQMPLEQNIYSQPTPRAFRPRLKTPTQSRQNVLTAPMHRLPHLPDTSLGLNFASPLERVSPEVDRRSSPETEFDTINLRPKSISPTYSDHKSDSSSSSNLRSSPDSSYIPISLVNQAEEIESRSGQGGMADTGFNQLGSTLCQQEAGALRDEEVKEDPELSPWESLSCSSSIAVINSTSTSPPSSSQGCTSSSSSPSRMPPTPTLTEPSMAGVQSKAKTVVNGVGRGAIGRGVKSKKRLNSIGDHNVGVLETTPCGWGELPVNPKENFDDGTEFWGQPEKPVAKPPDSDMLMYFKPSFSPYEMSNSNNTKHSSNYASLTDQQKRILQEIMQSNFDIPSDETPTHSYTPSVNSLYPARHFSESGMQHPSVQCIMQRSVIQLLMKQQYLQMQKGYTLVQAIQVLLHETKLQHQKLYSSLYQQGNKPMYSPQLSLNLQISNMLINLLNQQHSNVTAQPVNGFPINSQYINKSVYIPNISDQHSHNFEPHYPSPQEYQLYPPSQTPRQGQAKNQQWIVQQLVKFHMFNNENETNKNESKSVGKDPIISGFAKSLDPTFHSNETSQAMKYNLIRSSSLIDNPEYLRQRKQNSSMSSLHTEENFNFSSEIPPTLYEGYADKVIDPEEVVVFQDTYERVPPSPSFNTQGHTFSPKAPAFYPPGHFQEPDSKMGLFSSLPANLHPSTPYEPSPHLFYPNKTDSQLDYEVFSDLYQNKQTSSLDIDALPTRSHNKSPNQFNDKFNHGLLSNSNSSKLSYSPNYMMDLNSNSLGMKQDLLSHSLPAVLGGERSDATWLFLTGINHMIDKAQLDQHLSPLGSTSIAYSRKNRTAIVTFKQGGDASTARTTLRGILGPDAFETCEISSDPNELTNFIGKFAESPGSPVRNPAPWSYNGFSCGSMDSSLTSVSYPTNHSDVPQEEMSPFEEQIVLNYLPNGLLNNP